MAAKFWGVDSAKLEDFTVPSNCSGLNLPKAGSLTVYKGSAKQGCRVSASCCSGHPPPTKVFFSKIS